MGYLYWIIGISMWINLWCVSDGLFRWVQMGCSDDIVMGEVGLLELVGISC